LKDILYDEIDSLIERIGQLEPKHSLELMIK